MYSEFLMEKVEPFVFTFTALRPKIHCIYIGTYTSSPSDDLHSTVARIIAL